MYGKSSRMFLRQRTAMVFQIAKGFPELPEWSQVPREDLQYWVCRRAMAWTHTSCVTRVRFHSRACLREDFKRVSRVQVGILELPAIRCAAVGAVDGWNGSLRCLRH